MGLSYVAFACSIEEFTSIYSSRDEALFDRIVQSSDPGVRHYLDLDAHAGEGERGPGAGIPRHLYPLAELFMGAPLISSKPHEYATGLIACLYVLGTKVGSSGGGYGRQMEAQEAIDALGVRGELLPEMDVQWPVPGLRPVQDWPMYCGVPLPEVDRRAAAMEEVMACLSPDRRSELPDRAVCFLEDMTEFYRTCATMRSDLILVAH